MSSTNWHDILRDLFKETFRRRGGNLEPWPDSTIDDAPMAFVQAVYVQMGGDPGTLDLSKTPQLLVDSVLASIYVAVGGTHTTTTLIDDQFDTRTKLLWEYFVLLGGSPAPR